MSIWSRLSNFFRPLALVILLFAALFFIYFALSPTIELLPGGMDLLVGLLFGLLILILIITISGKHRRR
ncbi:MAG: hypothetical protein K9L32_04590 [Chromatiaceae bacterium]|nr:hypothetical protein [Chromatiaceae bacterium]